MANQTAAATKPGRTRKPKQAAREAPVIIVAPLDAVSLGTAENKRTKKDQLILMLRQRGGATLTELAAATGWLPHTARAALTGLRKAGHTIDKGKRDDVTCYSIKTAG